MTRATSAAVRRAMVGVAAASVAITVAGCPASGDEPQASEAGQTASQDEPDLSKAGRVDYACALAQDVKADDHPFTEKTLQIGDRADAGEFEISGASGLLGAVSGTRLPGHEKLSDAAANVYTGMTAVDLKKLNGGVAELAQHCTDRDLPKGDPDVSDKGRVAYACALAKDLKAHDDPVSSWTFTAGDDADPAQHKAAGAAGLLGATVGGTVPGHAKLSDAGRVIYEGLTRLRPEKVQQGIDDLARECRRL